MSQVELAGLRRFGILSPIFQRVTGSRFLRHLGVLTLAKSASAALTLVQGILVARWLGPELHGLTALVMAIPSLFYTFFDVRSGEASVKYLSEFHARGERARAVAMCRVGYVVDFLAGVAAFMGVVLLAPWTARTVIHRPELVWLVVLYGATFLPRALVGTSYAVMSTLGRFPTIAFIETLRAFVQLTFVLSFVLAGWQIAGVVWGNAIAIVLSGLLYSVTAMGLLRRTWGTIPWKATWGTLKGYRREIASFLAYNDLNALLGMIPKQLDVVLLGYFRNPFDVGYYKLAKSIAGSVGNAVGPLQSVAYPGMARLFGMGNRQGLRTNVKKLALQVGVPAGLVVMLGTLLVPVILPLLVGSAYNPAMFAAQCLLVGSAVWVACFWLRPLYMAQGRVRIWVRITFTVSVLSLMAYPLIIPMWGYVGLSVWWTAMIIAAQGAALALRGSRP